MIKKILLGGIGVISCITLIGCSNGQEAVITNLSTQLDRLNNSVNSISQKGNYELADFDSLNLENQETFSKSYKEVYQSIDEQDNLRQQVRNKVEIIKNQLGRDLKLGKENVKTLRNLTSNLLNGINSLNTTKSEYNSAIKNVNKLVETKDSTKIPTKITHLSNCIDARTCYYNNILNTLSQIQSIVGGNNSDYFYTTKDYKGNPNGTNISNTSKEFNEEDLQNLLYQYLMNRMCPNGNCLPNNSCPNGNCYNSNTVNDKCPANNINAPYGTNNGYITNGTVYNGYNNGYNGRFNPSRNTDTYGPVGKNIDTFRWPSNAGENGAFYNEYNRPLEQNPASKSTVDNEPIETPVKKDNNSNIQTTDEKPNDKATILNLENEVRPVEISKDVKENKDTLKSKPVTQEISRPIKVNNPIIKRKIDEDKNTSSKLEPTAKGHTNTLSSLIDINKNIEDLIHNGATETFETQYISLR